MPKTWFFEFTFIRDGKLKKQIEMECFRHGCTAFIELAKPEHDRPGWFIFHTLIDNRANLTFKKKIATPSQSAKSFMKGWSTIGGQNKITVIQARIVASKPAKNPP